MLPSPATFRIQRIHTLFLMADEPGKRLHIIYSWRIKTVLLSGLIRVLPLDLLSGMVVDRGQLWTFRRFNTPENTGPGLFERWISYAIYRINYYPADSVVCFVNTYPLDSDLSTGYRYPSFEQLGPTWSFKERMALCAREYPLYSW